MRNVNRRCRRKRARGFALIEAALAIVIVGLGVVALMGLFAAQTQVNAYGSDLSTAVFLAEELRAMTDDIRFSELTSFDGMTFNGVDANEKQLAGLGSYTQTFDVQAVDPLDLTGPTYDEPELLLLTATVLYAGRELVELNWLRSR